MSGFSSPARTLWLPGQRSRGLIGALILSVAAGIPAAYARNPMRFALENALAFVIMSVPFVPFVVFVIPLYTRYPRVGLCDIHTGLILACQLIALPFTVRTPDRRRAR